MAPPRKKPEADKPKPVPDASANYSKRLSELEDRIAAMEKALASQLGIVVDG